MWSITRNADVLTDALEQNEIDDPEIADIEDVGYDADGFKAVSYTHLLTKGIPTVNDKNK